MTRRSVGTWAACWIALAGATVLLIAFRGRLDRAHVVLVFLLVVLSGSAAGGRLLGVLLSGAAFLTFDVAFISPNGTLAVSDPFDWLILVAFLITSLVAAQLIYTARAARAAVERAEALRDAGGLKDALLAAVSHDIRTPLTSIKGLAHEISESGDDRAVIIEEEADRLNRWVSNLLDAARLDGGTFRLDIQINAIEDVLGAVTQQFAGRADRDRIRVRLDPTDDIPLGRFDFVHTLRIVTNLIENALKYSPADRPVDVTGGRDGTTVVIKVMDSGSGLPGGMPERGLEHFARVSGDSSLSGSAGLGLSIARGLAEAQSGSVEYTPRTGGGSVFTVRLPGA